jgi:hypothetical protein
MTYKPVISLALSGAVSARMGRTIEQRFHEATNELSLRNVQRHGSLIGLCRPGEKKESEYLAV